MLQLIGVKREQEIRGDDMSGNSMRQRVAISIAIAAIAALWCWAILSRNHQGAADFQWAIRLARHLQSGQAPYDTPLEQYPPAAALLGLPFVTLTGEVAGALFFGISSGLLAFGLTRTSYTRLLIFFAYPYWAAITAQWSPLVAASAFFWWLAPVALMKPNISLPVLFANLSRRAVFACGLVLAVSLALTLRWYWQWPRQLAHYGHFFPIAIFPGFLILLALFPLRHRPLDKDALLLLLAAMFPQRWFYDAFILWLIPKSRREIIFTVAASWPVALLRWYGSPDIHQVGRWSVLGFYLPMLAVILLRDERVKAWMPWNARLTSETAPAGISNP